MKEGRNITNEQRVILLLLLFCFSNLEFRSQDIVADVTFFSSLQDPNNC